MTTKFLIWSYQHDAWWGKDRRGYTEKIEDAGRYEIDEATAICLDANWKLRAQIDLGDKDLTPDEAIVPIKEF